MQLLNKQYLWVRQIRTNVQLKELPLAFRIKSESTLLFAIHCIYGFVRMKLIWIKVTISFLFLL